MRCQFCLLWQLKGSFDPFPSTQKGNSLCWIDLGSGSLMVQIVLKLLERFWVRFITSICGLGEQLLVLFSSNTFKQTIIYAILGLIVLLVLYVWVFILNCSLNLQLKIVYVGNKVTDNRTLLPYTKRILFNVSVFLFSILFCFPAKNGLSESELEDILSCDDDVLNDVYVYWTPPIRRLPPLLLVRLRTDLSSYLGKRSKIYILNVVKKKKTKQKKKKTEKVHRPCTKNQTSTLVFIDEKQYFIRC